MPTQATEHHLLIHDNMKGTVQYDGPASDILLSGVKPGLRVCPTLVEYSSQCYLFMLSNHQKRVSFYIQEQMEDSSTWNALE